MFKYIWIVILAIIFLIWAFVSIADLVLSIKDNGLINGLLDIEPYSAAFFITVIIILFFCSLVDFCKVMNI